MGTSNTATALPKASDPRNAVDIETVDYECERHKRRGFRYRDAGISGRPNDSQNHGEGNERQNGIRALDTG